MTELEKAARQALEALDGLYLPGELERVNKAIIALREALAEQSARRKFDGRNGNGYQPTGDSSITPNPPPKNPSAEQPAQQQTDERIDALRTLDYCHGLKAGWNFCAADDDAGFERAMAGTSEAVRILKTQPAQQQEPVVWMYPEGLEALKNGKPWTAYGTKQEANNISLYLHPTPEREPYAWVTFTPYGDEDDVWYENPEGKLLEGWTYKPLYDATPLQSTWVDLTEAEIDEICLGDEAKVRTALQLLKEKNT